MQTRERWKMRKAVVRIFVRSVVLTVTGQGQGPRYSDVYVGRGIRRERSRLGEGAAPCSEPPVARSETRCETRAQAGFRRHQEDEEVLVEEEVRE